MNHQDYQAAVRTIRAERPPTACLAAAPAVPTWHERAAAADSEEPLTGRQRDLIVAIHDHMVRHGVPPTNAELRAALGVASPNAINVLLRPLIQKGYVEISGPKVSRSIRLVGVWLVPSYEGEAGRRLLEAIGATCATGRKEVNGG